jgi:hypothetical protein
MRTERRTTSVKGSLRAQRSRTAPLALSRRPWHPRARRLRDLLEPKNIPVEAAGCVFLASQMASWTWSTSTTRTGSAPRMPARTRCPPDEPGISCKRLSRNPHCLRNGRPEAGRRTELIPCTRLSAALVASGTCPDGYSPVRSLPRRMRSTTSCRSVTVTASMCPSYRHTSVPSVCVTSSVTRSGVP